MTRLDCAIELLGLLCMAVSKNEINIMDKVEAVAWVLWSLEEEKELALGKEEFDNGL